MRTCQPLCTYCTGASAPYHSLAIGGKRPEVQVVKLIYGDFSLQNMCIGHHLENILTVQYCTCMQSKQDTSDFNYGSVNSGQSSLSCSIVDIFIYHCVKVPEYKTGSVLDPDPRYDRRDPTLKN